MDFETLRFAKFGQLDAAVTDWSTMVTNLAALKVDARDGLKAKADKADWSGNNANVTKGFVDKTVREFDDAHKQAESLWNILKDMRNELKSYRSQLDEAVERGLKKNLMVSAIGGGGFTVSMRIGPSSTGIASPEDSESAMNALRTEIQNILGRATESDHTGSVALKALSDQAELGFTGAEYKDRDSADNAIKQADALAAIAKKDPADLTVKEFDKLNAGLKKMSGDELFSARFAEKLKAQGMGLLGGAEHPVTAPMLGAGGVVAGGVAGTAADEIIGALTEGAMKDSSGEVIYRNGQDMGATKVSTYELVETAAKTAGERSGNPSPNIVASVASAAEKGFTSASANTHSYIDGEGNPAKLEEEK